MKQEILTKIKSPYLKFKSFSRKKKIIVAAIALIVLITVITQIQGRFKDNGYVTEKVVRASISETVTESGNIESVGKTDIFSPATGVVIEVYVQNGEDVKRGDKLFRVNSTATVQEQQAAYSNYLAAKSALDAAHSGSHSLRSSMYAKWQDYRDMATSSQYEDDNGQPKNDKREASEFQSTQDDWLAAEDKYKDSQTAVAQAQASVNSSWLLYKSTQDATVLAVADGTVSNLAVSEEDSVKADTGAAGLSLSAVKASTPVLSIVNSSKYTAKITVSESDINKIKPGQLAEIEVDAYKAKKYRGKVVRVDNIGTNINGIIQYNIYVEIENADENLRYGMTVDATIKTNEVKNVVAVSNSSVKPYKGGKAVRIIKNGEIEFVSVKAGIKGQSKTEIINGLIEGQEVITSLKNDKVKRQGMFGF